MTVVAGACISQPGGVLHNVIGQSDDLEIIDINPPADYSTTEVLATSAIGLQGASSNHSLTSNHFSLKIRVLGLNFQ